MFTSETKDTDRKILLQLSDKDLLNACKTNEYTFNELCDDDFFYNRIKLKYPDLLETNILNKSWKRHYLRNVYLIGKIFEEFSFPYRTGDPEEYYKILLDWEKYGAANEGMYDASKKGYRDLVNFFISKGADDWDNGLNFSSIGGHKNLVDFFITLGSDNWDLGMQGAAKGGHKDLIDFFISKGAHDWERGMTGAAGGGHKDLIDFFITKGAHNWERGMMGVAKGNHKDLVDFFISRGGRNFNQALRIAQKMGYNDLVKEILRKILENPRLDWRIIPSDMKKIILNEEKEKLEKDLETVYNHLERNSPQINFVDKEGKKTNKSSIPKSIIKKIVYSSKYKEFCENINDGEIPPIKLVAFAKLLNIPYYTNISKANLCGKVEKVLLSLLLL